MEYGILYTSLSMSLALKKDAASRGDGGLEGNSSFDGLRRVCHGMKAGAGCSSTP